MPGDSPLIVMQTRLLDLDGSLTSQGVFAEAVAAGRAQQVDLRDLGPALRLWTSRRQMDRFIDRLDQAPPPPGTAPMVTFLGSGDYHHLAVALIGRHRSPLSVVHFDNHPDWVRLAPRYHCGSWVNRVLEMRRVRRVITIGPSSDDLERPDIKGGNLPALRDGRLILLPWRRDPTRSWISPGAGIGHSYNRGTIHWHGLAALPRRQALDTMMAIIPQGDVWLTIDKDVLAAEYAATNWDQGGMPLDFLLQAIVEIGKSHRIVGVDICGEYAPPVFRSWLKRREARSDHARYDGEPDLARNEATNRLILDALQATLP